MRIRLLANLPLLQASLLVLMVSGSAAGQFRPAMVVREGKPLATDDAIRPLLTVHQETIAERYAQGGVIVPHFHGWLEVDSASARQLFPHLRFASLEWMETQDPRVERRLVGLAMGLLVTLAIDPEAGSVVATLPGHGNFESYGSLLVKQRISLRDQADAQLIWETFCDVHHKAWRDYPQEQSGDNEWRLGIRRYDQTIASTGESRIIATRTHYMRVQTDPQTHQVNSWESVVETSDRREVPMDPLAEHSKTTEIRQHSPSPAG